jgi:hypothetical protein
LQHTPQQQTDFFTSSSRSALRAVFATWSLEQCRDWLERDIGLALALEEATNKFFPASNSGREVGGAGCACVCLFLCAPGVFAEAGPG